MNLYRHYISYYISYCISYFISYRIFILFLLLGLYLLLGNASTSLWDEDEAAYALFGQRMLQTGEWAIPDFTWSTIHRKTPFHFWAVACSYRIFGVNEWALRLPSVLAIWLTAVLLWRWGQLLWSRRVATWSVIVLGASLFVPHLAKVALTDAWLLLCQTTAMLSLLLLLQSPRNWQWHLAFWAAISLGILVKGPPILILTGGAWLFCLIFHPQRLRLLRPISFLFGFLSILPFLSWIYAINAAGRSDFLLFLYDWYIAKRVGGSVLGQTGIFGYHFGVLLLSFFPFLPFVHTAAKAFFELRRHNRGLFVGIIAWLLFGWVFYELMTSKLPSYSLAAQPIFAVGIAAGIVQLQFSFAKSRQMGIIPTFATFWKVLFALLVLIWAAITAALLLGGYYLPLIADILPIAVRYPIAIALLISLIALYRAARQRKIPNIATYMAILPIVLVAGAWGLAMPAVENSPIKRLRSIAHNAKAVGHFPIQLSAFSVKQTKPSLLFYLVQDSDLATEKIKPMFVETHSDTLLGDFWAQPKRKIVALIGSEGDDLLRNLQSHDLLTRIDTFIWFSTDDKLKPYPFYLVRNF
jgi:4-amino-4-deoxy-L-arabinose transferase-like glycosyltransferase